MRWTRWTCWPSATRLKRNPVGEQSQDAYLNAVIHAATSLTATQLVSQLLDIERQLGRKRIRRWGPRSVDLDLLLLGDEIIDQPETTVPSSTDVIPTVRIGTGQPDCASAGTSRQWP